MKENESERCKKTGVKGKLEIIQTVDRQRNRTLHRHQVIIPVSYTHLDVYKRQEHCIAMVQSKVLKQLSILEQRKFDDEDIVEDVQFLNEKLQSSVQDLR